MRKVYFFLVLSIFNASLLAEEKIGKVWNYNSGTGLLTILPPSPGYFNMGETLFVFNENGKELGRATVEKSFHTKVEAISKGNNSGIDRSSIVVKKPEDFSKTKTKRPAVISYKDIANESRGWSVKVSFTGKSCDASSKTQARKLDFANVMGYQKKGTAYYEPVKTSDVQSMTYTWNGTELAAKSIKINNLEIEAEEIIASSPHSRLKPPSSCRGEVQDVAIELKKTGTASNKRIDVIPLTIHIQKPSKLKDKDAYILKIFSNEKFLIDYEIGYDKMNLEEIKSIINLPVYYFSPGINKLEAELSEGIVSGLEIKEGQNTEKIGSVSLELNGKSYERSISIMGKGKKLKLEAK